MLVLSLDTTSRAGSCALARDGQVVRVQASETSREQGGQLPGALASLLDRESVALRDIDGYGVAIGPGSFTGLRVGIASMQGLALATGKPLVGVSALDALAILAGAGRGPIRHVGPDESAPRAASCAGSARVAVWIEAWRGDVFSATYEGSRALDEPVLAHPDTLLDRLRGGATVFIGDGAARNIDLIRAACGGNAHLAEPIAPLLAGAVATVASESLRSGEHPLPHAIRPLYVRRCDAGLTTHARPL
jgi:tRNA threonylcarbamoyladenosine biosynthesis protein TsaB